MNPVAHICCPPTRITHSCITSPASPPAITIHQREEGGGIKYSFDKPATLSPQIRTFSIPSPLHLPPSPPSLHHLFSPSNKKLYRVRPLNCRTEKRDIREFTEERKKKERKKEKKPTPIEQDEDDGERRRCSSDATVYRTSS